MKEWCCATAKGSFPPLGTCGVQLPPAQPLHVTSSLSCAACHMGSLRVRRKLGACRGM